MLQRAHRAQQRSTPCPPPQTLPAQQLLRVLWGLSQNTENLPWIIPVSFQVLRKFPQDKSALSAILTPLSKLQTEIMAGMLTSTVPLHLGSTEKRDKANRSCAGRRKRGCAAGKQAASDKETIPAGRTRSQGPSCEQLL